VKIVKFQDGTYGLRKFSWIDLSWRYKDLDGPMNATRGMWWSRRSNCFDECCRGDLATVVRNQDYLLDYEQKKKERRMRRHVFKDKGTVVTEDEVAKVLFVERLKNGTKQER
jgi:hypothetical protein